MGLWGDGPHWGSPGGQSGEDVPAKNTAGAKAWGRDGMFWKLHIA